ncbi:hypothetical protein DH2020_048792 [Rehmannia glutinosa]|uniref:2Fe-2S ferredoxin-type domain-containing protein n=1 Tax=Rehmannia glutinosa TaxID=99300 RepID=A0ABR0U5L3_REHGL
MVTAEEAINKVVMDLQTPCNACIMINRKPTVPRQSFSRNNIKIRSKTVSELQTPVAVNRGTQSPRFRLTKSLYMTASVALSMNLLSRRLNYWFQINECMVIPFPIGCCTSCAVRVKSGQLRQPEALGISAELKDKGYALLCVGFPSSDLEVETQDEDEVYWLQFGRYFARGPIERDDYALELAMGDE